MQKINFTIKINAPREKVWDTMLDDATYRQWTKPFNAGSSYIGDWSEGSEMRFVGCDDSGQSTVAGMYTRIKENRKHEFISIEYLGFVTADGNIDTTSDEVKKWTPAFENYTFKDAGGGTELLIEIDITEDMKEEFEKMWPAALEVLKELAEK